MKKLYILFTLCCLPFQSYAVIAHKHEQLPYATLDRKELLHYCHDRTNEISMEIVYRTKGVSTKKMDDIELAEKTGMLIAFQEIMNFIY